jgi:NAD(P)-dependent dehydrogenase (short-subunit alcohol dehydrogenase family)
MTQAFAGRTALVTGADRGIGAGIANLLDQQGVRVCRNVMANPEVPDTGGEKSRNLIIQADLRDPNQVQRMFGKIKQEFGGLDLLINNAGVESIIPAIDLTAEEWDRVFNTNLRGAFLCSQAAARLMKAKPSGGVIINIASIHDQIPRLGTAHYCASKAGMSMLTKSLAHEWAEFNIRVVGISPGIVETEINREQIERFGRNRFLDWVPLKSLGTIADVAKAVAFLASEDARYISGTTLVIDGAYSLSTVRYDPRSVNP